MVLGLWRVSNSTCRSDGGRSALPRNTWAQKCFRVQTVEYLHRGNELSRPKSEHDINSCSHAPCIYHPKGIQHGLLCNFMPRKSFPGIEFLVVTSGLESVITHLPAVGSLEIQGSRHRPCPQKCRLGCRHLSQRGHRDNGAQRRDTSLGCHAFL